MHLLMKKLLELQTPEALLHLLQYPQHTTLHCCTSIRPCCWLLCPAGRPHRSEFEADREYELAVDEMKQLLGAGR
jgi:hypothetical protein